MIGYSIGKYAMTIRPTARALISTRPLVVAGALVVGTFAVGYMIWKRRSEGETEESVKRIRGI